MGFRPKIASLYKVLAVEEPAASPLSAFTTFRVGGRADGLVFPGSVEQVRTVVRFVRENDLPFTLLGRGSNVLFSDEGFRGLVMVLGNNIADFRVDGEVVRAEAGAPLPLIARRTGEIGLTGMEFAAGIPGSVGGAVRMNAGTREGQIQDVVRDVVAIGPDGERRVRRGEELGFEYRRSVFRINGEIVVGATFSLRPDDPEAVQRRIQANLDYRMKTQPLAVPSAGSVFKNPPGRSAGQLLDAAGCKGMRAGGAEVSHLHANWIVNAGGGRARDIWELICRMKKRVADRFGVELRLELELVGEGFEDPV